jgi:hypothetical protein
MRRLFFAYSCLIAARRFLSDQLGFVDGDERYQYSSPRKPGSRFHHEIADDLRFVIEAQVHHLTNGAVGRANGVAFHIFHAV